MICNSLARHSLMLHNTQNHPYQLSPPSLTTNH